MGSSNANIDKPRGFLRLTGQNGMNSFSSFLYQSGFSEKSDSQFKDVSWKKGCRCVTVFMCCRSRTLTSCSSVFWVCVLKWNDNERGGNAVNVLKEIKKKKKEERSHTVNEIPKGEQKYEGFISKKGRRKTCFLEHRPDVCTYVAIIQARGY